MKNLLYVGRIQQKSSLFQEMTQYHCSNHPPITHFKMPNGISESECMPDQIISYNYLDILRCHPLSPTLSRTKSHKCHQ